VGGNLLLGGASNIYGGKAVYAGNTVIVSGASFACGGLMRGLPVDISTLEAQVSNLSSSLAALATNGVATEELSFLTLTGQDPTFNVFKVDASELGNIRVNVPANSTTIVNVSGINAEWDGASVCLNGSCDDNDQATNVLWNFYETTSLYVSAMALEGSVLAPWAALTGTGGHIAGQVIVRTMNAGLEFHRYLFDGCVVPP
jgi:choice-of-anchor A domain-containing protein